MKKEKIDYKKEKRLKKRLEKEADHLWHLAVIKKYGDNCFFIDNLKRTKNCQKITDKCHHYFAKGKYPELRYVIINGVPICWPCHFKLEQFDKSMVVDIILLRGKRWYESLIKKSQEKKFSFKTIEWYNNNIKRLQKYANRNLST